MPIYPTIAGMSSITVPVAINAIRVNGRNAKDDGDGGLFVNTNNGAADKFSSHGLDAANASTIGASATTITGFNRGINANSGARVSNRNGIMTNNANVVYSQRGAMVEINEVNINSSGTGVTVLYG